MAAELMETLSAPLDNIILKSSIVRIPPPTVNGIDNSLAPLCINSLIISRSS